MEVKDYVIVPDLQIPHEDPRFVKNLFDYIKDRNPYGVIFIGDNVDCTAPARWNKATAEEFSGSLQHEFDKWKSYGEHLRRNFSGLVGVHFGNHEKRIRSYLLRDAPAFSSLRSLRLENLLSLDELEFTQLPDHYDIAPGWVTHHGDYASISDIAGRTAANYAAKIGKSVICGHTHRAGIIAESTGYNARLKTRYGMEVGHGMLESKAHYTNGVMNWQKAFGTLEVVDNGKFIVPGVTYARQNGSFVAEGKIYG
jgi:hypothetical protein